VRISWSAAVLAYMFPEKQDIMGSVAREGQAESCEEIESR